MEYEIKSKEKLTLGLGELWQYRELFYFFTWRDIKIKYKQTVLGFAWAVLQPLIMMLIFNAFLGTKLYDASIPLPYPIFIFSGLLLWNFFSTGISAAGTSMVSNADIIKKIYFPRLIIPISSVLVALFDFFMACILFIILLAYYQISIHLFHFFFFSLVGILITSLSSFGLGSLLAALNIKYRDFRYIIPFMVQALLFISPVFYQIPIARNSWFNYFAAINPMYAAIELFRKGIMYQPLNTNLIALSLFSSLLLLICGIYYFRKTEAYFADLA